MGKLKYLVIHCTATPEGREVSSADIRKWHTSPVAQGGRGWIPDVRIIGHNELAAKACPSFDVQEWLKEIGINQ